MVGIRFNKNWFLVIGQNEFPEDLCYVNRKKVQRISISLVEEWVGLI